MRPYATFCLTSNRNTTIDMLIREDNIERQIICKRKQKWASDMHSKIDGPNENTFRRDDGNSDCNYGDLKQIRIIAYVLPLSSANTYRHNALSCWRYTYQLNLKLIDENVCHTIQSIW